VLAATNLIGSGIDIPAADLIVITDSDAFGESEIEQLIGRVGRRERPSDAVLMTGTTFEKNPSRAMPTGRAKTFMPAGMRARQFTSAAAASAAPEPMRIGFHTRVGGGYDAAVAYARATAARRCSSSAATRRRIASARSTRRRCSALPPRAPRPGSRGCDPHLVPDQPRQRGSEDGARLAAAAQERPRRRGGR
jgi:superfamily II DNA/RNA helicase